MFKIAGGILIATAVIVTAHEIWACWGWERSVRRQVNAKHIADCLRGDCVDRKKLYTDEILSKGNPHSWFR